MISVKLNEKLAYSGIYVFGGYESNNSASNWLYKITLLEHKGKPKSKMTFWSKNIHQNLNLFNAEIDELIPWGTPPIPRV